MIALLPTLGLPVLAGVVAQERLAEASTATRLERDLLAVVSLDQLREALTTEGSAGTLTVFAKQFGMPFAMISGQLGWKLASLAEAEAATDQALAAVPRIDSFHASLEQVRAELPSLRASFDSAAAEPSRGFVSMASTEAAFERLLTQISDAEQSLAKLVGSGADGTTSAHLLASTQSFDATCEVIAGQVHRAGIFYRVVLTGSPSRADSDQLAWESKRYEVLNARLDARLDQQAAQAWHRVTSDEQFKIFDRAIAKGPAAVPGMAAITSGAQVDPSAVATILPVFRAVTYVVSQLSAFLQHAARDAAVLARSEATDAQHRAVVALAAAGLVIAATIVALFVIGGILSGRLNHLAQGAKRLSAGYLEPVVVQGPRELAATSEALNAAVDSLRHVQAKAILLASGDLESPELEQPAPGPLGAAVNASVSRIVTAVRDREELQRQLAHQASHDVLTGLPNRAELDRTLGAALARAQRSATAVSVLFVDLDGFKACNDRYGHAAGDHVLRQTAQRLREAVRPGDVVGRLGGDEFIVVVEGAPPGSDTLLIGERIIAMVSQPIDYEGQRITIGASVGLSGCDRGQATADQIVSEADAAVYHAKASGRGCVIVHDQNLRTALRAQQDLETAIQHGLDHHEFVLHYQPVIDLGDMHVCGLEALVRWQKPGVGLVMPGEFIPAIESGDLILDVDRWVLQEATAQLVRWSHDAAMKGIDVWVNISGRHLSNGCVIQDVRTALENSGLAARRLGIEITETVPIDNPQAVEHLRQLSALGVRLALDDFGTGHTSISQLLNLPIDVLKLDRSLISGSTLPTPQGPRPISQLVIEMAHSLGLTVVAEGIEDPEQMAALLGSRCDRGQGYLISRPVDPGQIPAWIASVITKRGASGRRTKGDLGLSS